MKDFFKKGAIVLFTLMAVFAFVGCEDPVSETPIVNIPIIYDTEIEDITSATIGTLKGINGGTFAMGNADTNLINTGDERPVRDVSVDNFYLAETEVTQAQWEEVMTTWSTQPTIFFGLGDDVPAYDISWYAALEFCNALSIKEGLDAYYNINKNADDHSNTGDNDILRWVVTLNTDANGYRLPTEAEWEYAAGGGSENRTTYAGTDEVTDLEDYAWYNLLNGAKEVKQKSANALGLYDMSGNVAEWCWDWHGDLYYSQSGNEDNPIGPTTGEFRVYRGGAWEHDAVQMRVASRRGHTPSHEREYVGFRVARSAN